MSSSSSFVLQHRPHVLSVLLSSLLQGEKDDTRRWLLAEMDRRVDPMLDSIFNRLNNKLVNTHLCGYRLENNALHEHVVDHVESSNAQMHRSTTFNVQQSTSAASSFNPGFHHPQLTDDEEEYDPEILAQVKREIKEEQNEMTVKNLVDNGQNQQIEDEFDGYEVEIGEDMIHQVGHIPQHPQSQRVNTLQSSSTDNLFHNTNSTLVDDGMQSSNHGISDYINHQPNEQMNDATHNATQQDWQEPDIEKEFNETGNQLEQINLNQTHYPSLTNASTNSNEQSNYNLTNWEEDQMNHSIQHHQFSPETNNVEIIEIEDDDDEGQNLQEIASRGVKRPRPSGPTSSSSTQETQIITVTLQCPLGCTDLIGKHDLNKHMRRRHLIRPFRCLVKDCRHAFDYKHFLSEHIKQFHQSTTHWHCDKCDHHFISYQKLSYHTTQYHQTGHFQCSFPSCTFTGEYKKKVYNHYKRQHKPILNCQHSGCLYQTRNAPDLKRHGRIHSGIKPYRCKWPGCNFATARKGNTIGHILLNHLAPKPGSVPNGAQLDPKDYVEVLHDLL